MNALEQGGELKSGPESLTIAQQIRSLEFLIEGKMERDGVRTSWLDSFRNLFVPIAGAIDFADLGIAEEQLPTEKAEQIRKLKEEIIDEAQIKRTDKEAQKILQPLVVRLAELFD